jgi:hypothetical protein
MGVRKAPLHADHGCEDVERKTTTDASEKDQELREVVFLMNVSGSIRDNECRRECRDVLRSRRGAIVCATRLASSRNRIECFDRSASIGGGDNVVNTQNDDCEMPRNIDDACVEMITVGR